MEQEQLLNELMGMLPSPTYIIISILFGAIGLILFQYGRKTTRVRLKWGGIALMFYPYLIGNDTRLLTLLGFAICALLYFWRE
jgi:hypothetical protein